MLAFTLASWLSPHGVCFLVSSSDVFSPFSSSSQYKAFFPHWASFHTPTASHNISPTHLVWKTACLPMSSSIIVRKLECSWAYFLFLAAQSKKKKRHQKYQLNIQRIGIDLFSGQRRVRKIEEAIGFHHFFHCTRVSCQIGSHWHYHLTQQPH